MLSWVRTPNAGFDSDRINTQGARPGWPCYLILRTQISWQISIALLQYSEARRKVSRTIPRRENWQPRPENLSSGSRPHLHPLSLQPLCDFVHSISFWGLNGVNAELASKSASKSHLWFPLSAYKDYISQLPLQARVIM